MFNVGYSSAKEIKKMYEDTTMIYLMPPTKEELLRRLGDRGAVKDDFLIKEEEKNKIFYGNAEKLLQITV